MKRIVCVILVLILCLSLACPVFAAEGQPSPSIPVTPGGDDGGNDGGNDGGSDVPGTTPSVPGDGDGEGTDAPYTGDEMGQQMAVYGGMMAVSLAAIVVLLIAFRKRSAER